MGRRHCVATCFNNPVEFQLNVEIRPRTQTKYISRTANGSTGVEMMKS